MNYKHLLIAVITCASLSIGSIHAGNKKNAKAEQVYQGISPDVLPELAHTGPSLVGVKTIEVISPNQLNIATQAQEDRKLTVELWFPAEKVKRKHPAIYEDVTRSHKSFKIMGNAFRKATITPDKKYPLVILSHGYTGYRTLMFYIGEHLASHGYIVAAIDHTDSTNADVDFKANPFSGFPSTLYHRSRDQHAVLNYLTSEESPFINNVDTENAGVVGYSMGGYGVLNTIGGCYSFLPAAIGALMRITDEALQKNTAALLSSCAGGQYQNIKVNEKWKAAVAIAPWGGQQQVFSHDALKEVTTPILIIAGDQDDVSQYAGIRSVFNSIGTPNRYMLTYQNARHNIAAHPAPKVARSNELDFGHYWEPAWDIEQVNAVNKHFVLAMMNCYVKDLKNSCEFLDLKGNSTQTYTKDGLAPPWKGFPNRYSTGMIWER